MNYTHCFLHSAERRVVKRCAIICNRSALRAHSNVNSWINLEGNRVVINGPRLARRCCCCSTHGTRGVSCLAVCASINVRVIVTFMLFYYIQSSCVRDGYNINLMITLNVAF
jgi:hypothetical protein